MQTKCQSCGTVVQEDYTHTVEGGCLCILCAFAEADPTLWRREDPEKPVSLDNADE